MRLKIVNYHALAFVIKQQVQESTGRDTTINTLVLAIKRFSDKLPSERTVSVAPNTLKGASITLASDIAHVVIRPKNLEFPLILKNIAETASQLSTPPDVLKSSKLVKVIADEQEYISLIRPVLDGTRIEKEQMGLSRLTVHLLPEQAKKKDPTFQLFIAELLYRHGIDVVHSYIDEDTIIIVEKADGPRAYGILQSEILLSNKRGIKDGVSLKGQKRSQRASPDRRRITATASSSM